VSFKNNIGISEYFLKKYRGPVQRYFLEPVSSTGTAVHLFCTVPISGYITDSYDILDLSLLNADIKFVKAKKQKYFNLDQEHKLNNIQ